MTFLQFLCTRLIGPPASGSSYWHCPFCDGRGTSFSVQPPKPNCEIKFRCHRCTKWGDEFDLIKHFYPSDDYQDRLDRIQQYRTEYEICRASGRFPFRGMGSEFGKSSSGDLESALQDVKNGLEYLKVKESIGKYVVKKILPRYLTACKRYGVQPGELLEYWLLEQERWDEMLQRHADECDDQLCSNECRAARDLPPLTDKQRRGLEAGIRKVQLAKARSKRASRKGAK